MGVRGSRWPSPRPPWASRGAVMTWWSRCGARFEGWHQHHPRDPSAPTGLRGGVGATPRIGPSQNPNSNFGIDINHPSTVWTPVVWLSESQITLRNQKTFDKGSIHRSHAWVSATLRWAEGSQRACGSLRWPSPRPSGQFVVP